MKCFTSMLAQSCNSKDTIPVSMDVHCEITAQKETYYNSNNGTAESLQSIEEIIYGLAILTSVYLASRNE